MAVSATMIEYVSPYRVDEAGPFTSALYQYYVPLAAARLVSEGLESTSPLYDHCHALMIAHLYTVKGGETALKSFTSGGLSWSKNPGDTPFLLECRQIIADQQEEAGDEIMGSSVSVSDVQRADADVGNLKLDRTTGPVFFRRL